MQHYALDLPRFIIRYFFELSWKDKLGGLKTIIEGLKNIHQEDIIHRDYHSGNIMISRFMGPTGFITGFKCSLSDIGISKSSISNDDHEIYGIIPYIAPEIFQGQQYTKASDVYGFGMIMWELLTGRRPFWNRNHDTYLIIEICDGLRPPIVTNAPEGYNELMQCCWNSDPFKRPTAANILSIII
ncbi:2049_t:CDS:1, partial [Funneliformis geosporum]